MEFEILKLYFEISELTTDICNVNVITYRSLAAAIARSLLHNDRNNDRGHFCEMGHFKFIFGIVLNLDFEACILTFEIGYLEIEV